ncbi:MAG: putative phosphotransacetylase [Desulforhopalus sp.]|jgi:putative phosphotransacetylase
MAVSEALISAIVVEVTRRLRQEAQQSPQLGHDDIPIELSARHAHLSEKDWYELFKEAPKEIRELSQPGQYLFDKRIRIIGPKGVIDNIAILGPFRKESQIELSVTDSRILGINAPVRHSGDLNGTPGAVISSHDGIIALDLGVIVAGRHIHMSPADATRLGVKDMDLVCIQTESHRPVIFRDVLIRVNKDFRLSMHIDFDEGNASGCTSSTKCTIIKNVSEVQCAC